MALENLDKLEQVGMVKKADDYQDMLTSIGRVRRARASAAAVAQSTP